MRSIVKRILIWAIAAFLLLLALSINNILWVNSSPEWNTKFTVNAGDRYWIGPVQSYSTTDTIDYLFFYRIATVWTNWRDLGSAVIVGVLAAVFSAFYDLYIESKRRKRF